MKATLKHTAEQRIHQHSSETYQRCGWEEERKAAENGAGGRHNRGAGCGARRACQANAAAGACRYAAT
jgi:hypothetical protein